MLVDGVSAAVRVGMQHIRTVRTIAEEVTAGAIACTDAWVMVGTQAGGYLQLAYPQMLPISRGDSLWRGPCRGVQAADGAVILLGQDTDISHASPADWGTSLRRITGRGDVRDRPLGPGNWALVKGIFGDVAYVWDVTEGQGILAVDVRLGVRRWALDRTVERLVAGRPGRLLGLTATTVLVLDAGTGAVLAEHPLPENVRWTAVAEAEDGLILGGSSRATRNPVLARWGPAGEALRSEIPLGTLYPVEVITVVMDEDRFDTSIFDVASLLVRAGRPTVVIFGGDGERLGEPYAACALATIDSSTLVMTNHLVIDESDECSGLLDLRGGSVLVDCGGTLHIVDC